MRVEGGGKQMLGDIIACGIAAGAFAVLGILLVNGKCLILVTAYFAATPNQREAYGKVALGRFAGGLMFFFAGCVLLLICTEPQARGQVMRSYASRAAFSL